MLPEGFYDWKPDSEAMTAIQIIRHVLQADYGWNMIINKEGMDNYHTPWDGRFYFSVDDELIFAEPYRQNFLQSVRNFSGQQLADIIIHPGSGSENFLGNYLLRSAYHESVHAGQFISYLREIGVERPFIWD
ncbi:DinB family protein [Sphingobacterium prati]|uniref:DinB family protein n=1 Tax=Sphingobacterium prati TaxID=2737006 RepID=UPI001C130ACE